MTLTWTSTMTVTTTDAVEYSELLARLQQHPDVSGIQTDEANRQITFTLSNVTEPMLFVADA